MGKRKLNRPTSAEGIVFDSKLYHLSHSLSLSVTYPDDEEEGGDDEEGREPSDDKL